MRTEKSEFNRRCNEIADHMIANQDQRNTDRIRRFEQDARRFFGDNFHDYSVFKGSQLGIRCAAVFFEDMDDVILEVFILGAKLSGGRKTNQN